jgi:hypothetical protein
MTFVGKLCPRFYLKDGISPMQRRALDGTVGHDFQGKDRELIAGCRHENKMRFIMGLGVPKSC